MPPVDRTALLLRGVLDMCLLATAAERQAYGYELVQRLGERGLVVADGSIYPALGRLEKSGLLAAVTAAGDGGPPRKYYRPTPAGRAALRSWRHEWEQHVHAVDEILGVLT